MAKQLINPIERHVEKAVLGLAVLVLVGVAVRYLVASPNQIQLGGETVLPNTIDAELRQVAANVRERFRRAVVEVPPPALLYGEFEQTLDPFRRASLPMRLPPAVAIGPEVPTVDPFGGSVGNLELVDVVGFEKVGHVVGRSTYRWLDRDGAERRAPANWVTLSAVFNVKRQTEVQATTYGRTLREVVFGPVELQRRAGRPDGSWSDEDWGIVKSWPAVDLPQPPAVTLVKEEGRLVVPSEVGSAIARFHDDLVEPERQLVVIRPLMPEMVNGTPWAFPVLTTIRDVLVQDDYYKFRNEAPATEPANRYKKVEEARTSQVTTPTTISPAEMAAQKLSDAERLIESARKNKVENDAVRAWNLAKEVEESKEASSADKSRAQRIRERADQVAADIRRSTRYTVFTQHAKAGGEGPGTGAEPEKPVREPPPIEQVWAHDNEPGSVMSGRVYQYRMRVHLYNHLLGNPARLRNKSDAQIAFVVGEWTDPIEIAIEPSTYFFASGKDDAKKQVSVEFFQWFEGVWLREREKFGVGDHVSCQKVVEVPRWDDPTQAERATVEFSADTAVVAIDFERPYRERRKGSGRTGVTFGPRAVGCCAVFADPSGQLMERWVETDKGHPDKRVVQDRLWRPQKKE